MLDYLESAAAIAAALDDAKRSLIGDPREGVYKVSFTTNDMKEAMTIARQLARIGIVPTTTISHDVQFGHPIVAHVNIYSKNDQRRLLNVTESKLKPEQCKRLSDLVLARGPIPDDIIKRICNAHERRMSVSKIAQKLEEHEIVAGMGGKGWTPRKVRAALRKCEQRSAASQEAA
jgi:hypothetical protein